MKCYCPQIAIPFIALLLLSVWGCGDTYNQQPTAAGQTESREKATDASVTLDDGVYPVVNRDASSKTDSGPRIVELVGVPIDGSSDVLPDKIRVVAQPLLRFRNVSNFDFTFANNECTAIGFQNSDELKAYTRDHLGEELAVVIANKVISQHKIQEAIETEQVRITCCAPGGGDHLYKHLQQLKRASDENRPSSGAD